MDTHAHYPTSSIHPSCPTCTHHALAVVAFALLHLVSSTSSSSPSTSSSGASTPPSSPESSSGSSTPPTAAFSLDKWLEAAPPPPPPPSEEDPSPPPEPAAAPVGVEEERAYLELLRRTMEHGELRSTVKGVGALALFAPPPLTISLSSPSTDPSSPLTLLLPLLTTKRVFPLTIAREFLWMLSGSTDANDLREKGVKIWDAHGARDYLDFRGLSENERATLGPYESEGVDQVREVIRQIKEEPEKRRKIITAWDPADISKMALPPCPTLVQFYVHTPSTPGAKPLLSCSVYQRSADLGLGLPFDIVTYALLTHTIAHLTSSTPSLLHFFLGDAHVYLDHVSPLRTQFEKEPAGWTAFKWKRNREEIERAGGVDAVEVGDWAEAFRAYRPGQAVKLTLHP
ncbi:hypothetical protein JCM6882_002707 [Rhodosporidiobolus microsporus]